MKCKICNSDIPDDVICCPYCDTYVDDETNNINVNNTSYVSSLNNMNNGNYASYENTPNNMNSGNFVSSLSNTNNGNYANNEGYVNSPNNMNSGNYVGSSNNMNNSNMGESNYIDSLIGKRYTFDSPIGMNLLTFSIFDSSIKSQVEIAKDRLFIDIKPKRKNTVPVIMTEDILAIQLSKGISIYHIILAAISLVADLASPWTLLLTAASIYFGLYTKIRIIQKNGLYAEMFSTDSAIAENFKQDIKRIVNIR